MKQKNLLEVLKNHAPKIIGDFLMIINIPKFKENLQFEGYFTKDNNSIYANFEEMNLIAGSHDRDPEMAKIKSIMRLLDLLKIRLKLYKNKNDFSTLFTKEVSKSLEEKFIKLNKQLDFSMREFFDEKSIPVYTESIHRIEGGYKYKISKLKNPVTDLKNIQSISNEEIESKSDYNISKTSKKINTDIFEFNFSEDIIKDEALA